MLFLIVNKAINITKFSKHAGITLATFQNFVSIKRVQYPFFLFEKVALPVIQAMLLTF